MLTAFACSTNGQLPLFINVDLLLLTGVEDLHDVLSDLVALTWVSLEECLDVSELSEIKISLLL